jgi:hypothetical protein
VRFTARDSSLLRDLALSHVLSRDQILRLGYFASVTRVNTRLRELASLSLVRRLETPFFGQGLYVAGKGAGEVVGARIARLLEGRGSSPRLLQHALAVTEVRLALSERGPGHWRFEQQLWRVLDGPEPHEIRPDGLFTASTPIFVEVDLGHVALPKFREKLTGYRALARSGQSPALYQFGDFRVLTVTTGGLRARHLRHQLPPEPGFELLVQTFADLGVAPLECWS